MNDKKNGFVITAHIERTEEIQKKIEEIISLYSVNFEVLTFHDWVEQVYQKCLSNEFTTKRFGQRVIVV
jgi:hypothetical protein